MQTFEVETVLAQLLKSGRPWLEFLREPTLSMGLYRLKAGDVDRQQPHTEDEVYVVQSGKAWFHAGGERRLVGPGSIIFVERDIEHRFEDIAEDLTVLVFFAPPEGANSR